MNQKADTDHEFLDLTTVEALVPLMKELGVSEIARSPRGFLSAYRRSGGDARRLPAKWRQRRCAFIARHMAQLVANDEPLYDSRAEALRRPTRRHLALVAWAYSPDPRGIRSVAARMRHSPG